MRTALITIAHGRHAHWARQCAAVAHAVPAPDDRILVVMDDEVLASRGDRGVVVCTTGPAPGGLPLAAARNLGASRALERGAELLVFLDVDCLPAPDLFAGYADAAATSPGRLLCGPVTYLPPPGAREYALDALARRDDPHPARPAPRRGEVMLDDSHHLFWSLSFAATAATWRRVGGFDEEYVGYGGEDTDLGRRAAARGVGMAWVGGARAYHQHHEVESPPTRHLDAILRNGAIFARRWGEWPMKGWLEEFVDEGLVEHDGRGGYRRATMRRAG